MAWFRKERKQRRSTRERLEIPRDAWDKCSACGHTDISENFDRELSTCPSCGHHRRFSAAAYIKLLTDADSWIEMFDGLRSVDTLRFDSYPERLTRAHKKAGDGEAVRTGAASLEGDPISLAVMDFGFMGGSMGSVVGEKIARLAQRALVERTPLIIVSASGGARMQEGVLSLMQMAKTSVTVAALRTGKIPFVSILTNPTTGGVSASFAMQGDVIIAEPGAVIGFAGPRVIKQTIGQDLPEGFQTAEFLLERGMVDMVVSRLQLRPTVVSLLRMMTKHPALEATH